MRGIAAKYATTPERLMRINGLRKPMIFPGQTLLLSATTARASRATRARVAAIRARNEALVAERSATTGRSGKVALSSKVVKATPKRKSVKASTKKRSGADPKASARTKSKSAKRTTRAG
jgi:LysM repeat protein